MSDLNANTIRNLILDLADLVSEDDEKEQEGPILGFSDEIPEKDVTYFSLSAQKFRTGHLMIDDEEHPLPGRVLRGYIKDVKYDERQSDQYGLIQSLRVLFETDEEIYMMSSGLFANTSKSILRSLAEATDPDAVYAVVPKEPPPRKDGGPQSDKVIFIDMYEDDRLLMSDYYPQTNQEIVDLLVEVQEFFGASYVVDPNNVPLGDAGQGGGGYSSQSRTRQTTPQQSRQQGGPSRQASQQRQSGHNRQSSSRSQQGVSQDRRSTPRSL